jgi:mRNA interferase MazF
MPRAYCPKRGDVVWLSFSPHVGHEQGGHRPALALSPEFYNRKSCLAMFCPITTQVKGYPYEVLLPAGLRVSGAVLVDHAKSLDWVGRGAQFCCRAPEDTLEDVLAKLETLIWPRGA